jgi:DNA-binding IscR family transcriptional regulator
MEENIHSDFLKNRPLERIFRNNIARIIDFLIINQQFKFTCRELSNLSDIPLRSVQRIMPQLVKNKIVIENKFKGKIKNYELNKNFKLVEILSLYSIETINVFVDEAIEKGNENTILLDSKLLDTQ